MSAHVYRALQDTLYNARATKEHFGTNSQEWEAVFSHLQTALDHNTWTEQLDTEDYNELQRIVFTKDPDTLIEFIYNIMPIYGMKWYVVRCPGTREDWRTSHMDRNEIDVMSPFNHLLWCRRNL